jgi:hypothetical protein
MPNILPRSLAGNHAAILAAAFGKAPASPAPNANLVTNRSGRLETAPVSGASDEFNQQVDIGGPDAPGAI